jgi:beta-phosphoglucomutase
MLRGVIFDLDGVIVDSHPIHKKTWRTFLSLLGKDISEEDLNFIMEGRKRGEILRHFLGDLSEEQVQTLGRQKEQLFRQQYVSLQPIAGLREFLQELDPTEIKLAVASSGSSGRVNDILDSLDFRNYFEAIVTGDQVKKGKPDPAIFLIASDLLGVSPAETLVFEDSVSGVIAAKAAGMMCFGVASNGVIPTLLEVGADHIIPDFSRVSIEMMRDLFRGPSPNEKSLVHQRGAAGSD